MGCGCCETEEKEHKYECRGKEMECKDDKYVCSECGKEISCKCTEEPKEETTEEKTEEPEEKTE